jgi:hypothetical protein
MSSVPDDYRDIVSVPRDGTLVEVFDPDVGAFEMFWNPAGANELVSTELGIWECPGGHFTWCENDGLGPSYWRPVRAAQVGATLQ